ncbi:MAG TPA: MFS transporter, partial [Anaerolineaceae bacterium]|nr:MFS transporter [Anaerolineaceae bacterium]
TVILTIAILSLLLGLNGLGNITNLWYLLIAIVFFIALISVEKNASDPIIPFKLFSNKLCLVAIMHGILAGWAMFGSLSYIPLFVQAVIGTTATQAGISLTPMSLSWTLASIFGGRLILKMNFRLIAIVGMALLSLGSFLMTTIGVETSQLEVMFYTSLMGIGMGLTIPIYMIIVQTSVRKNVLGTATSTLQFSRSIGGTIGVSVLGVFLSSRLAKLLIESGFDIGSVSLNSLINQAPGSEVAMSETLRVALSGAMANMFYIAFGASLLGLLIVFFTPKGKVTQLSSSNNQN